MEEEEEDGTGRLNEFIPAALLGPCGNGSFVSAAAQMEQPMSGLVMGQVLIWLCDGPGALEGADLSCLDRQQCEGRGHTPAWENQAGGSGMSMSELLTMVLGPYISTCSERDPSATVSFDGRSCVAVSEAQRREASDELVARLGGTQWARRTVAHLVRGELTLAAVFSVLRWIQRILMVTRSEFDSRPRGVPGGVLSGAQWCTREIAQASESCAWVRE